MNPRMVTNAIDIIHNEQQQRMSMLDLYGNSYPKGVRNNPSIFSDSRLLTMSFANSISKQSDIIIKLKSERSVMQRETNVDEKNHSVILILPTRCLNETEINM
jgi:hypothetical protein